VELDPKYVNAYTNLGNLFNRNDRQKEAHELARITFGWFPSSGALRYTQVRPSRNQNIPWNTG